MAINSMLDDPQELFAFCSVLRENGNADQAIALAKQALAERRHDPEMVTAMRMFLSIGVHYYHRSMLADHHRNEVYDAMLQRHAPGRRILDIGTGTGLLAMMAVRAGAEHVYACEINKSKADLARDIIAKNGMGDKITLLRANSMDLDKDRDLGGGVDAVVSELYTANVIGESLIQTHVHAQEELTLPGAIFLPAKVSIMGALASYDLGAPIGDVTGFDLSLMEDRFAYHSLITPADALQHQRGPAGNLCDLEFRQDTPIKIRDRSLTELSSNGGRISGVLYWMRIECDVDLVYENCPGGDKMLHWAVRYEPFPKPVETKAGDTVRVGCAHNSSQILIWNADAA